MDWTTWEPNMRATLLFLQQGDEVLLIRKKRGLGAGKINGPGGRLEPGESPEQCIIREVQEELGITVHDPLARGILRFHFTDGLALYCTVFTATAYHGTPTETDEAIPHWIKTDRIPYDEMWEDDRHWLPGLLAGQTFDSWFEFDGEKMLSRRVEWL
jgi:8-oxo-dGTP diphosphatase